MSLASNSMLPPPPTGDYLSWITQKPEEFAAYIQTDYALSNLVVAVTFNGITTNYPIQFAGSNSVVTIKLS